MSEHRLEDVEFSQDDLDTLLAPTRLDHQLPEKLRLAQLYMRATAASVDPSALEIVDPNRRLLRFEEVYLTTLRLLGQFSEDLAQRVRDIEKALDLSQNVVLLGSLARDKARVGGDSFLGMLRAALRVVSVGLPGIRFRVPDRGDEKMNASFLLEVRTALFRIAGLVGAAVPLAEEWWREYEDVLVIKGFYDPRLVSREAVAFLLDQAVEALNNDLSLPPEARASLVSELSIAAAELRSRKTPWNRALSRISQSLMVLAAIVTVSGGPDEAAQNVAKAYRHVEHAVQVIGRQAVTLTGAFGHDTEDPDSPLRLSEGAIAKAEEEPAIHAEEGESDEVPD